MTKISKHFRRDELECKCGCGLFLIDAEFLQKLEAMRGFYQAPILISSGTRCERHNIASGGMPTSYHLKGMAVDIICYDSKTRFSLVESAMRAGMTGVGVARNFVHVDNRKSTPLIFMY